MTFTVTPTADTALLAVQKAVVAHCRQHLSVPVFDYVPEDAPYPYVRVGEAVETPENVHGRFGRRIAFVAHVWTKGREGFGPALAIAGELQQLFDRQQASVPIDGNRFESIRFVDARPMGDPDPLIRHVPVTLAFHTEQEPLEDS